MNEVWVVNASPLIALARVGRLSLLSAQAKRILVPEAVASEVCAGPTADPARAALEGGFGERVRAGVVPEDIVAWSLGAGESAVLAVARAQSPALAIIDDAAARACARAIGVPVMGTLGVVLRAKRLGIVSSAADIVRGLRRAGLYIADSTIASALATVGETWEP